MVKAVLLLCFLFVFAACNKPAGDPAEQAQAAVDVAKPTNAQYHVPDGLLAFASGADDIPVKDFHDEDNPFRDEYEDWDYWVMTNLPVPTEENSSSWNSGEISDLTDMIRIWVTPDGYPVPMRLWWRDYYNWLYTGVCAEGSYYDSATFEIALFGEVDPGVAKRMHRMEMEEAAPHIRPVPKWLAENPPLECLFLPRGEVIGVGELGTGADSKPRPGGFTVVPEHVYYRYSAQGLQLDKTELGEQWWELYFFNWKGIAEKYDIPNTHLAVQEDGIIEIVDLSFNRKAIYQYIGSDLPLDYDTDLDEKLSHLYGRDLPVLYEIQQAAMAVNETKADHGDL